MYYITFNLFNVWSGHQRFSTVGREPVWWKDWVRLNTPNRLDQNALRLIDINGGTKMNKISRQYHWWYSSVVLVETTVFCTYYSFLFPESGSPTLSRSLAVHYTFLKHTLWYGTWTFILMLGQTLFTIKPRWPGRGSFQFSLMLQLF